MNQIIRSPAGMPAFGERNGDWIWNGVTWVCSPCNDMGPPGPPCPPPGFPPPGCPPWFSGANSPPWYPGANAGVSFGTTPPPNPVRGHFWWDGVTMWLFDGAAWSGIGGPGTGATASVGSSPPSNPSVGTLWFDGNALLVWNGTMWAVSGGGTSTGTTPPANPQPGQQWWNGATLFIWDGNAWVPTSQTKSYVQPTAPPNPNPGDLWFDGAVQRIWSGTSWMLVGPGSFVGPVGTSTITFAMAQNAAIAMTPNQFNIVAFTGTPLVDTQTAYDPITHRLTPKQAGMYLIEARGLATGTVSGLAVVKNDTGSFTGSLSSDIVPAIASEGASGISGWFNASGFVQMNGTTDFLRMWWYNSGGSFPAAGSQPCFSTLLMP